MGDRNTILGVAIFIFVALTAAFGGVSFHYKLEAEAIEQRILIEKDKKEKVRFQYEDPTTGINNKINELETTEIEKVQNLVDNKTDGLQLKIGDKAAAAKDALLEMEKAYTERKGIDSSRKKSTDAAVKELGSQYDDMVKGLLDLDKQLKENEGDLKKIQDELLVVMSSERGKTDKAREEILTIKAKVAMLVAKLARMRERSKRLDELQKDGVILSADSKTNLGVVNLGQRHGVRPGMVFDIFEVRRDGKKVRKGKLRLRRVEAQQSFAVILAARESPKLCPQCGWSTNDITHLFCPYCLGGEDEKEREAQRLVDGSTRDRIVAQEFLNPVKKGDFISSPFYLGKLKKRAFTFAVIGRTVDRSRQEIRMFLKENGCNLVANVGMEADFAIVGMGTNVGAEIDRARKMGVSVIRESELFDFFGKAGVSSDELPAEDKK
jgi:NAD-dependent DNA ligase